MNGDRKKNTREKDAPRIPPAFATRLAARAVFELRAFLFLTLKEIRTVARDRQSLALLFLMPMAFIFLLSYALKDVHLEKAGGRSLVVFVRNDDEGLLSRNVTEQFLGRKDFAPCANCEGKTDEQIDELLAAGTIHAAVHIPRGFPSPESPAVLRFDPTLDAAWRGAAHAWLGFSLASVTLELASANEKSQAKADLASLVRVAPLARKWQVLPTPLQQTVPAWSIFAMFFVAVPLSNSFHRERSDGVLARLRTYPLAPATILLAKMAAYWILNVLQFAAMLVIGVWFMPRVFGQGLVLEGNAVWLLPVTLVTALASTAFATLVAALARTHEQAAALTSTTIIVLAVLGGVMVPPFVMPAPMRALAGASPLYWSLQSYHDILLRGGGFSEVVGKLGVLIGFALAFVVGAQFLFRRARLV